MMDDNRIVRETVLSIDLRDTTKLYGHGTRVMVGRLTMIRDAFHRRDHKKITSSVDV